MSLLEMLPFEYGTKVKVTLNDGTVHVGFYTGYNHADENYDDDGNEIGIPGMDLEKENPLEYWQFFEDDIKSVELA